MRGSMKGRMKLSGRLFLGFGVVLLVMVVMIVMGIYNLLDIDGRMNQIIVENNVKIELSYQLMNAVQEARIYIIKGAILTDQAELTKNNEELQQVRKKYNDTYIALMKMRTRSEEGNRIRAKIGGLITTAASVNNQLMALEEAHDKGAEDFMLQQSDPAMQAVNDGINEYIQFAKSYNHADQAASTQAAISSAIMMLTLGIVAVAVGTFMAFYITRSITKPVNRIVNALNGGAQEVAAASNQLSASAQQLSQGSAEQAAAIEETSSTLQESASMLQQNTVNTKQAALLSMQANESANRGGNEMQEMMGSIQEIKKSSDQIAKIIKVIDDIAFQTNILALNAAIEAARAGEAGMGFAVVAEEVRNLAQRSAQAAQDTTSIIEANIELSGKGVAVADRVREALNDITAQAKKVNELMEEISAASQEETQGVDQVTKAMTQIETVTQQNAANAEESASAAEELTAQSEGMRKIVLELSQLVNGKAKTLQSELEFSNYGGRHHLMHHAGQPAGAIGASSYFTLTPEPVKPKSLLPDKKTKVIAPEDVIPLEKDPPRI